MQIKDDVDGHFNWVSDIIQIMNENNIKDLNVSNSGISHKLKDKFHDRAICSNLLTLFHMGGGGQILPSFRLSSL